MILIHNTTDQPIPLSQLGDRDYIDPTHNGRAMHGQILLPPDGTYEITRDEITLFASAGPRLRVEVHND